MIRLNDGEGAFPQSDGSQLIRKVEEFFSTSGPLSQFKNFEFRAQQQEMAIGVVNTLLSGGNLIVEAGTGVGKSLGYLVPAILYARSSGKKAIISTNTINLQEQLCEKDLPLLEAILGVTFSYVLLKGRQNYLCRLRLHRAIKYGDRLFTAAQLAELKSINEWALKTEDGSLSDLDFTPDPAVWSQVCSERGLCNPKKCGDKSQFAQEYGTCHYQEVRSKIVDSDLIVLNHTLFFVHLGGIDPEKNPDGILFKNDFVIFDEAHTVENVASRHVGMNLSSSQIRFILQRIWSPKTMKGLINGMTERSVTRKVEEMLDRVDEFFSLLEEACDSIYSKRCDFQTEDRDSNLLNLKNQNASQLKKRLWKELRIRNPDIIPDVLSASLAHLVSDIQALVETSNERSWAEELLEQKKRLVEIQRDILNFLKLSPDGFVFWVERTGKKQKNFTINSAPADISQYLRDRLFHGGTSIVMTSATLSTREAEGPNSESDLKSNNDPNHSVRGLQYFCQRIGASGMQCLQLGSPFDYAKQARLFLVKRIPDPRSDTYMDALCEWILFFIQKTHGHAFVLFTSVTALEQATERISQQILDMGIDLLIQGQSLPRSAMLEKFKAEGPAVLFGLDSFWQGVDVPGDALQNVILTRLPFAVPDHPLIEAKIEVIESRGGNAFFDFSLPEAVLKFRQGFGRLIRTRKDSGIVVVLDNRILTKRYGKIFLDSLPQIPTEIVE